MNSFLKLLSEGLQIEQDNPVATVTFSERKGKTTTADLLEKFKISADEELNNNRILLSQFLFLAGLR